MSLLLVLSLALPQTTPSQQPADLLRDLDSPNWGTRSAAISRLNAIPLANLPPEYAAKAIRLLEREAVDSPPGASGITGEGYGEYMIELMEGVLRLRDPRSTKGMALVGIQMSRDAQEFVAAQGAAALPYLDEAWGHEDARESIGETWGYMLTTYASRLSRGTRLQIIRRVLDADTVDAQVFANAADGAALVMAIPLLDRIAATDKFDVIRYVASETAGRLRARRDSLTPDALVTLLSETLDALCLRASGKRAKECASLAARLPGDSLAAFARRVDVGFQQHVWTGSERRVLSDNARYVASRRPRSTH